MQPHFKKCFEGACLTHFSHLEHMLLIAAIIVHRPQLVSPFDACAAGIDSMQFVGNGDIVGMVSREGEVVPLKTRIKPSLADGAVEKWLVQVPASWHSVALNPWARSRITRTCYNAGRTKYTAWPPCVLGASSAPWCSVGSCHSS